MAKDEIKLVELGAYFKALQAKVLKIPVEGSHNAFAELAAKLQGVYQLEFYTEDTDDDGKMLAPTPPQVWCLLPGPPFTVQEGAHPTPFCIIQLRHQDLADLGANPVAQALMLRMKGRVWVSDLKAGVAFPWRLLG